MHTPSAEATQSTNEHGVGAAVKDVTAHAKALIGLELELAKLELGRKVAALGIGLGLVAAGAVVALYALGFLLATVAAALATFLPTWLALLIVALVLAVTAGVLVWLALGRIRRGTPPVPEQAIREAKLTTEAMKS